MDDKTDQINKLFEDHEKRMNELFEQHNAAEKAMADIILFMKLSIFTFFVSGLILYFKDLSMFANIAISILITALVMSVISFFKLAKKS